MSGFDPEMRYLVYSLESNFPPWDPYSQSDNCEEAIAIARAFSLKSQTTVYVVDREQRHLLSGGEIYVHLGPMYKAYRDSMRRKLELLKHAAIITTTERTDNAGSE